MASWPITFEDVTRAAERIRPHVDRTPLRGYAPLDDAVGHGLRVLVKHENHLPTNAFKARNGMSALLALPGAQRERGVVAATRGNHGQGLAWAGGLLGVPVTVCVPDGNSADKNRAMVGYGAELIESGRDYDDAVAVAERLVAERGMTMIHSTNHRDIIAGAGTLALELADQAPELDALVVAVGGGSQAVGALTVLRRLRPDLSVYAVQAENAAAIHDSWHAGRELSRDSANTIADGLATRHCYEYTFGALREGLTDFVTVSEDEIADAIHLYVRTTHNLAEGAGAAGLAGLCKLAPRLEGATAAVILSGANLAPESLHAILSTRGGGDRT